MSKKLTKRELEIVRLFKNGRSIGGLEGQYGVNVESIIRRFLQTVLKGGDAT